MSNDNLLIFKALADEKRLKIISILKDDKQCACVLLEKLTISQPTLSYHMDILCDSKLVKSERKGKWVHYSINKKMFEKISMYFTNIIRNG